MQFNLFNCSTSDVWEKTRRDHYLHHSKPQGLAWPNQSDPGEGCTLNLATNATRTRAEVIRGKRKFREKPVTAIYILFNAWIDQLMKISRIQSICKLRLLSFRIFFSQKTDGVNRCGCSTSDSLVIPGPMHANQHTLKV